MELDGTSTITKVPDREVRSTGTDRLSKELWSRCIVLSQPEDPGDVDVQRLSQTEQQEESVTPLSEADPEIIVERAVAQEGTNPVLLELGVASVEPSFPTGTTDRASVAVSA